MKLILSFLFVITAVDTCHGQTVLRLMKRPTNIYIENIEKAGHYR